jgi:hypothetical protein
MRYLRVQMDAIFEVPDRKDLGKIEISGVGNKIARKALQMLLSHAGETLGGVRMADMTVMEVGLQDTPKRPRRRTR